ncbi:Vacuolar-sorting protein SNF7 [Entomortierella lignicola]|nr:Vacuolar-sorting protein SNF7 [Entomortierella lignicola]
MSGLESSLFNLKFTAKQLKSQSKQCVKAENQNKTKLKKAIQQGNMEGARIYAADAIRNKNEALNLLRLSSRIDAVASRVQTAVTMRNVTQKMGQVVTGMDVAMKKMDLETISKVMEKFESQFEDLDVQSKYMESAMGNQSALTTPQDEVDTLMHQVADEHGLAIGDSLKDTPDTLLGRAKETEAKEQDDLSERLRALRG